MQNKAIQSNTPIQNTQTPSSNIGKTKSLKPILEQIELKQSIPLQFPQNVLNQVRYLCSKIWEVEWSGVLFYTTEGEFGTENFKVELKHIFPMHKGSATYTEFETNEEYVEFLMDNPEYLQYQRGLIHSHNNMAVFFSGTDNNEIVDNSEFYNYYLSVIVNNKEEICAKIAFRGKTIEEINRTVTFRGTDGVSKTVKIPHSEEKEVVFIYNCNINKETEQLVDEVYSKRVQYLIEKANVKPVTVGKSFSPTLFEPIQVNNSISKEVESFAACIVALDSLNTDTLLSTLLSTRKKFGTKKTATNEIEVNLYVETIKENFRTLYHNYFEDVLEECLLVTLEEVADLIETHSFGNWIADEIYAGLVVLGEELEQIEEFYAGKK